MLEEALTFDRELQIASRLATDAGAAIRRVRDAGFHETLKADHSPVTQADVEADRLIRDGLREAFPEDTIVSEEGKRFVGTNDRAWIVDPLDGTESFLTGGSEYCVQIGLLVGNEPKVGVVYEPESRRLYQAIDGVACFVSTGAGATVRGLRVSKRADFAEMGLVTSTHLTPSRRDELRVRLGLADAGAARSVGYKVGMLVRRDADVYFSVHPVKVWDSCAPLVVLAAAGGTMTMLDGSPLSFDLGDVLHPGPFLASNGTRHDELLEALRAALEASPAGD